MPSPTIKDVSLMGPNTAVSPEIQAQLAKQALSQQIAEALISQSMDSGPASFHTGGNNPFARDVANFGGPISAAIKAYVGNRDLSNAQDASFKLAGQAEGIRQRDTAGVDRLLNGFDGPGEGQGTDGAPFSTTVHTPGDAMAASALGNQSSDPRVQSYAAKIAETLIKAREGRQPTAGDLLSGVRNSTAPSVGQANVPQAGNNPYGFTAIDASKLVNNADNKVAQPGEVPIQQSRVPGGPVTQGPPVSAGPGIVTKPGDPTNISGLPEVLTPGTAAPKVMAGAAEAPSVMAQKEIAKQHTETLATSKAGTDQFVQSVPKLQEMHDLLQSGIPLGFGQEWITKVQRALVTAGMSTDDAGKIKDVQTYLKLALPQAANTARAFNSRATQLEFVKFLDAAAAGQDIDPRAAMNIVRQTMADGVNFMQAHENHIEQVAKLPAFGEAQAHSFDTTGGTRAADIMTGLQKTVPSMSDFTKNDSGMYGNKNIAKPPEAKAAPAVEWKMVNGKLVKVDAKSP